MSEDDLRQFITTFQDFLAPKLDVYEQAIYLYVFRHSRLIGLDEIALGLKSARHRLAVGIGTAGSPMSESTATEKLLSLQKKGCIEVLRTTHAGRLMKIRLPSEIPHLIPDPTSDHIVDVEALDFYSDEKNRLLLLKRENYRCFYTLKTLVADNFVIDHVTSRPLGDNSYRNCVAASREANNRKGAMAAEDFLRKLYREDFLSENELEDRLSYLRKLKAGELKPPMS